MREITLRIRHNGEPECEVSSRYPAVTIRSVSSMTGRTTERKRIIELRGPAKDIEAFLEEFRQAESVIEAESLSPLDNVQVYVALVVDAYKWDSISERFSDMGVHYRMGTTINAGIEQWTVYLEPDDDLSAIIRSLERADNDVELVRNVKLSEIDRPPQLKTTRSFHDLTERQREVLTVAIELGYYDHAGGIGLEEVAREVGLGTTTVWEHLSRGEAKVMNVLQEQLRY